MSRHIFIVENNRIANLLLWCCVWQDDEAVDEETKKRLAEYHAKKAKSKFSRV